MVIGPLQTIQRAWERAHQVQKNRNDIYTRLYQRYKGYNPNASDPYRSNLVMPELYAAVETIAPRIGKALFGRRPLVPITSKGDPDGASRIESVLDTYLYRAKFKVKGTQLLKSVALFGTSFLEPLPRRELVTRRQMMPSPEYPFQPVPVEITVPRFGIELRQYMPWQVYVEPHMLDLESPGFVIILEIIPREEIEKMVQEGRYQTNDPEKLKSTGETNDKKFSEDMLKALNITRPDDDRDYGVLMRYQSKERYITAWNALEILEDIPNPFKHKKINIVRCAWNQDPMLQNSFWGQPEGKAMEAILDKYDEMRNITIDNADITTNAVIGFREEAVDAEHLVYIGGGRIPIKGNWQGSIRDAVDVIETRGLPPEAYEIPELLHRDFERGIGVYGMNRGESTQSDRQTATESSLLASHGDLRNESRAEILESIGLSDFADKCTSHIDQFAGIDDLFEIIGPEAMQAVTMNPHMLSGGFDYQFKGSDSVNNDFQKRADMRSIVDILQVNPAVKPDGLARKTLELIGWNSQEINEVVMTPEEFGMMIQQQQQQQDAERMKDLEADIIREQVGGEVKAKVQASKPQPSAKRPADKAKRKAAKTPTMAKPDGGAK